MELDTAQIIFSGTNLTDAIKVSGISSQCYKCDFQPKGMISSAGGTLKIPSIDTRWPFLFMFKNKNANFTRKVHLKEYGIYTANIKQHASNSFDFALTLNNDPMGSSFAFFMFLVVLLGLAIIWPIMKRFYRTCRGLKSSPSDYFVEMEEWEHKVDSLTRHHSIKSNEGSNSRNENNKIPPTSKNRKQRSKRLRSVDTFRGIAIVAMIFVNYSGGRYYFIDHSIWNGLTISDLVFPWFIFIMGMSMQLSYKSFLKRGESKNTAFIQISLRSVKLFLIGLILNSGQSLLTWRIPGVLQRFSICYFVVASLNILTSPSEYKLMRWSGYRKIAWFLDILPYWFQWLFIIAIVVAHTCITFLLPVPGCPTGYLGPGGWAESGKYFNCTGGAAGYIDRVLLGDNHIYGYPTCKEMYGTKLHFDPEGLLGFLPSIFLTFLGLQAGRIVFMIKSHVGQVVRLLVWAVVMGGIGVGLTYGTINEGVIPINKNLWSLSFVLVMAALSNILFVFCYVVCDLKKIWNGSPFSFCGMNAILLYIGHSLVRFNIFWHHEPQSHTSHLVVASCGTLMWIVWAYVLHRKKLFFTV